MNAVWCQQTWCHEDNLITEKPLVVVVISAMELYINKLGLSKNIHSKQKGTQKSCYKESKRRTKLQNFKTQSENETTKYVKQYQEVIEQEMLSKENTIEIIKKRFKQQKPDKEDKIINFGR